jgi:fibrillarin-like rRNA methylase
MKHLIKDYHKWRKEREKLKKEINTAIWNHKVSQTAKTMLLGALIATAGL